MKKWALCLIGILALSFVSCSSSSSNGDDKRMTYDQAVRQIGRPPTRAISAPGGGIQAMWETEVSGGRVRHLIMRFDADKRLVDSRTETLPRRRR